MPSRYYLSSGVQPLADKHRQDLAPRNGCIVASLRNTSSSETAVVILYYGGATLMDVYLFFATSSQTCKVSGFISVLGLWIAWRTSTRILFAHG
jgi:hypothetical protein